jgi:hypothetical protein
MIRDLVDRKTKLYTFMKERRGKKKVRFDNEIWLEALNKLSEFNKPDYYFDFEDRIIEEIVSSVLRLPPAKAKAEVVRIKSIIDRDVAHRPHSRTFLRSIRNSVKGAVAVVLNCL